MDKYYSRQNYYGYRQNIHKKGYHNYHYKRNQNYYNYNKYNYNKKKELFMKIMKKKYLMTKKQLYQPKPLQQKMDLFLKVQNLTLENIVIVIIIMITLKIIEILKL